MRLPCAPTLSSTPRHRQFPRTFAPSGAPLAQAAQAVWRGAAGGGAIAGVAAHCLFDTGMLLQTARLCCLPIDGKGLEVIALSALMLPTIGSKGRPGHIDLILALRRDKDLPHAGSGVSNGSGWGRWRARISLRPPGSTPSV